MYTPYIQFNFTEGLLVKRKGMNFRVSIEQELLEGFPKALITTESVGLMVNHSKVLDQPKIRHVVLRTIGGTQKVHGLNSLSGYLTVLHIHLWTVHETCRCPSESNKCPEVSVFGVA